MGLSMTGIILEGRYYTVLDFPEEEVKRIGPKALRKACAYRYNTEMTHGIFPYWGVIDRHELKTWDRTTARVGLYFIELKDGTHRLTLVPTRTEEQQKEYRIGNEKDILAAVMGGSYSPDQFMDTLIKSSSGDVFMPPLREADDFLNSIMKTAIRLKATPFDTYKKRLEALAADRTKRSEGINIANNSKRALLNNDSLSASKFLTYADTWELEAAIVVRDAPGADNPMFEDGKMLVIYPNGISFEIPNDKLVNIADYINENLEKKESSESEIADEREATII